MTNEELKNLIDCIKVEVQYDVKSGKTTTTYNLPKEAKTDEIEEALIANFEHYKIARIQNGILILEHPDVEE